MPGFRSGLTQRSPVGKVPLFSATRECPLGECIVRCGQRTPLCRWWQSAIRRPRTRPPGNLCRRQHSSLASAGAFHYDSEQSAAGDAMPSFDSIFNAFVTILVTVDPPGLAPLFLALTRGMNRAERMQVALRGSVIALVVLALFAVA